jgi:hypothetical protein
VPVPDGAAHPEEDPLARLRESVQAAQEAAERLMGGGDPPPAGDRPPPRGWEVPSAVGGPGGATADAAQAFAAFVDAVRAAIPRELAQQLAELVRELLLALRALIDWCLERLQARRTAAVEVEEIPID